MWPGTTTETKAKARDTRKYGISMARSSAPLTNKAPGAERCGRTTSMTGRSLHMSTKILNGGMLTGFI